MKICCACNQPKELKQFYVSRNMIDGYFARCKNCYNNRKKCKPGRKSPYDIEVYVSDKCVKHIKLVKPSKEDYVESYNLLKKLGYDLSESIHKQFCDKYNLVESGPKEFPNYYSPKDLDMS